MVNIIKFTGPFVGWCVAAGCQCSMSDQRLGSCLMMTIDQSQIHWHWLFHSLNTNPVNNTGLDIFSFHFKLKVSNPISSVCHHIIFNSMCTGVPSTVIIIFTAQYFTVKCYSYVNLMVFYSGHHLTVHFVKKSLFSDWKYWCRNITEIGLC